MSKPELSVLAALALELSPGAEPGRVALGVDAAGELAGRVAFDLARIVPDAARLDLVLVAGLFDPVELLRPGYPLHAELGRLAARAPGAGGGQVIGFGAGDQGLPAGLAPNPDFAGGPFKLLPLLLRGSPEAVAPVGEQLEQVLLDTGMASADTALQAQTAFRVPVEHARLLTINDLAAMMAMQYEHAGISALWPVIETALLDPGREQWLDAPPEPLVRYSDGAVRMALLDIDAWAEGGFAPPGTAADLARAFEFFQARQRQFATLLEAHGLAVTFDHCPAGREPRQVLAD